MGYQREIRQNSIDSHQTSPGYVVTFLRWSNRSTKYYNNEEPLDTRNPFVVVNDAVSIVVSNSKKGLAPTTTIVLKGGDINYATAVHPGDFVFVNMLNWEEDARRVAGKARAKQPINKLGDGFKGVFRIQNVVKNLKVDPASGKKSLTYTVTAAGFTEFNNVMYYNPAIAASFRDKGATLWSTAIGEIYQDLLKSNSDIQVILKSLLKILIGKSRKDFDAKIKNYGNTHFKVPTLLGALLGRPKAKYATEIFNYLLGVWPDSRNLIANDRNIGPGFNPGVNADEGENFYKTKTELQGNKEVFIENWNNNTVWSILQGNLNAALNEMYTTYRVSPDNRVMPTVVIRQKPFTNSHFKMPAHLTDVPKTKFLELPRWVISANLLLDQQTSKNEAARHNFVQVFTRSLADVAEQDQAQQIALTNFVIDEGDIQRQGLRPYVVTSNFDFPTRERQKRIRAAEWANLVADWIIDGHLKESGTFKFAGIQDPISVGDNLEFDNIVYHIESVSHSMNISPNGKKMFRTSVVVSYGIDKRSNKNGPVYANMVHTDAWTDQVEDWEHERILPGIGDTQDIPGRVEGEEAKETKQKSFTPPELTRPRRKTAENRQNNTGEDLRYSQDDGGRSGKKKK